MKNFVYLAQCETENGIGKAVSRALEGINLPFKIDGQRVFIKANLMKGASPERALNTHPETLRGIIRWIKSKGGEPFFGDSSGIPGHTLQAAKAAGYLDLAREEGVPFVNLDAGKFVPLQFSSNAFDRAWVSRAVLDADLRFTVPKMKTHTLMGFSGALKNQMGLLPGGTKARLHVTALGRKALARAILEINQLVPFHAGLMDGTMALEGGGSSVGYPRWIGCVMACKDLLALDLATCALMGWDASESPILREARRTPLGNAFDEGFHWIGDKRPRTSPPFKRAGWDPKRLPVITRAVYRLRERSFKPDHSPSLCLDCGECEKVCPTYAVHRKRGAWIDWEHCIWCFACTTACPEKALVPKPLWFLRPFLKSRMQGVALQ